MISVLVGKIMSKCKLKQQELADLLGVPLARVKRLAGGSAKKFTPEEQAALIEKLDIRAEWLVTGQAPMFQDDEPQEAFVDRMRAINQGRAMLDAMPLSDVVRERTGALLTGEPDNDGPLIAYALQSELAPTPPLTARESALVENYRAAPEDAKKALETTSSYLAQSPVAKGKEA